MQNGQLVRYKINLHASNSFCSFTFLWCKTQSHYKLHVTLCKGISIALPQGMRRAIIRLNRIQHSDCKKKSGLSTDIFNLICKCCWLYEVRFSCKHSRFLTWREKPALRFIMWKWELLAFTPDRGPLGGLLFQRPMHVIWDTWTRPFHIDSMFSHNLCYFFYITKMMVSVIKAQCNIKLTYLLCPCWNKWRTTSVSSS